MNVTIVFFSPTGNTESAAMNIKRVLEDHFFNCKLMEISGNSNYFRSENKMECLKQLLPEHDILIIGGPVYAHHFHYNMLDLIENLPASNGAYGKLVFPFVTYGGINSGVALDEATRALKRSGRIVGAGLKLSMTHHMSKVFMPEGYNADYSRELMQESIKSFVEKIKAVTAHPTKNQNESMVYQNYKTRLKAKLIFNEKKWHKDRYPKLLKDLKLCINCGDCKMVCPVKCLELDSRTECIHCFKCVFSCPVNAISLQGNPEKARAFMQHMIDKGVEKPQNAIYPE